MEKEKMTGTVDRSKLIIPAVAPLYEGLSCIAYPLMRIVIGGFLIPHGMQKLFGLFGGAGMEGVIAGFTKMGLEPAPLLAYMAGCTEFFGGILIVLGLFTRVAAAGAFILLITAASHVHYANGFFAGKGGYEYALLWAVMAFYVFIKGGGHCSLDRKIGKEF